MSDLEHAVTVERSEWRLFRKQRATAPLAGPEKVVMICLVTFYGGILAGATLYTLVAAALHFGRLATDTLGIAP